MDGMDRWINMIWNIHVGIRVLGWGICLVGKYQIGYIYLQQ